MRICIVIPVYNEERIVRESLRTILSYVKQLSYDFRIAVVDDGSRDNTRALIEECRVEDPCLVVPIIHEVNKGYGAALRSGIAYARANACEYVLFMDSDLTNHPKYIRDFCGRMLEGVDYIKASRYGRGAGVSGVPWHRRIMSLWGNAVARLLFGLPLHDLTNGFRAVKTSVLSRIELTENGFGIIMEELFLTRPFVHSYAEVPYVLTSRAAGQGTTHFTYDLRTYSTYLRYALMSAKPVVLSKKGRDGHE